MKNLAIIPVRIGSKRLPKKNILPFGGLPMFVHTYNHAVESGLFDQILVSTESDEVISICDEFNIPIPFKRPDLLATDSAQLVSVIDDCLDRFNSEGKNFENFCLLWATAPLRSAKHILEAYEILENDRTLDGVLGTTTYNKSVFSAMLINEFGLLEPVFPQQIRARRTEQPTVVVDNSSMVWNRVTSFLRHKTWLPPKLAQYPMPATCSVDLDTEEDLRLLEFYTLEINRR